MKWLALLLLSPVAAFGTLTVTDRGVNANNTSEPSTVMTVAAANTIAAGSTGVLYIAADNANGASTNFPVGPITDSVGNKWYRIVNAVGGSANANVETACYYSILTTPFTSSNNITITYTTANVTAKCWSFIGIAPSAGNIAIFKSKTLQNGSSAAISLSLGSIDVGTVYFCGAGAQAGPDTFTGDSDTTNGTWSTMQHTSAGTGTAGMSIITQWKVQTTANGTQSFDATLTSAVWRGDGITFTEVDPKIRAFSGNGTSSASSTVNISLPLTAGSTAVLALAVDNMGLNGSATNLPVGPITDSAGNTWTLRQDGVLDNGVAGAGAEVGIYTSTLTANLVASVDTITITFNPPGVNVPAKTWAVWEFSNATGYANSGVGAGAIATTTPTITTGSITTPNIVVGVGALETDVTITPDSDTVNGSWSTAATGANGAGAANSMSLVTQYKATTASGAQTYNVSTGSSSDTIMAWVELTVPAVTANTAAFFPFFP